MPAKRLIHALPRTLRSAQRAVRPHPDGVCRVWLARVEAPCLAARVAAAHRLIEDIFAVDEAPQTAAPASGQHAVARGQVDSPA